MTTQIHAALRWALAGLWLFALASGAGCQPAASNSGGETESGGAGTGAAVRRIIILTNGNSPFWDACRAGLQDADRGFQLADAGLRAVVEVNDGTTAGQLEKLRQFATQSDVAAVGISAVDAENVAVAEALDALQAKGVPVVTVDSDLAPALHGSRYAYLGTNNIAGGRALGICAKNLEPEGGEYVTFVGMTGAQNAIERIGGFAEGAGDKFVSKDSMGDEFDRTRARENVRNSISNHPDLNCLVGIWSYNAPAIVDVVRELNARDRFTLVAFDAEPLAIQQMQEGDLDAMVVQNPYNMGYHGVELLKALIEKDDATVQKLLPNHGEEGGDIFDTGLKVVVPDDDDRLQAGMFDPSVQFMKLQEFKAWLEKYNLEGS